MSHFSVYYVALNLPVLNQMVMELSSDHTMNSVLELPCLGQSKECTEVPILLMAAFFLFGVGMRWAECYGI